MATGWYMGGCGGGAEVKDDNRYLPGTSDSLAIDVIHPGVFAEAPELGLLTDTTSQNSSIGSDLVDQQVQTSPAAIREP
jgi:hypothetical protein